MKRVLLFGLIVTLIAAGNSSGKIHSWKGGVHLATAPFIAGTGIYSSVRILQNTDVDFSRVAAISNLSLLGLQTTGGALLLFGSENLPLALRTVHKIIGMGVIASGVWLSIAGSIDDQVPSAARYTAYGHTVLAAAPILLFTF